MSGQDGTDIGADAPVLAGGTGARELPATARGLRTRAALVTAARTVFERDGFLGSRLSDITVEAKCSAGTFYTYFSSKEEIFAAVLEAAQDDMLHPGMPRVADDDDPAAVIEASNRAYLVAYLRNAKLMALMQQVATVDPDFEALRRHRSEKFVERNARHIAELQSRGLADETLDPLLTSYALSGMVSRMAMEALVIGKRDLDDVVAILTKLWVNALQLSGKSDSRKKRR
ncbi:TetR/AcrR family transcriptional regulator [[Mycobacterium] burgundiense]|uniref:TetR/AcrR family transcriptional regulator n=1 Tax=[Mycobacterium] burgundiense TaxID=3064286 RepID=A0ABM9M782_9MYCO|nr:TetR/AcrR family transcriptional regulator [Mycolicibacterium sp. MU0053]CAJ1511058.1 TetR/AcrR family transcriptional regulator [Mycolicibacterium sp. MU0053]